MANDSRTSIRVLVCPTAFKGSMGAAEAARAMAEGAGRALPGADLRVLPVSDGGPGLIDALRAARDGARQETVEAVTGPTGGSVRGRLLLLDGRRTVALESADACGLALLAEEDRDPLRTHTTGVGDLLRAAFEAAPEAAVVGLGGSATCDGGAGAARRLGYRFLDDRGRELRDGGGALAALDEIRPPSSPSALHGASGSGGGTDLVAVPELRALADVDNPLLGPEGAAATYAPQKGAGPAAVERLEEGLRQLVEVAARDLPADPARVEAAAERPGAGAAGGLAFGLEVFLGARVDGGARWVLRRTGFDEALGRADLVLTGEGAYDRTTERAKVVGQVLRRARRSAVPVALVCGRIEGELPDRVVGRDGGGARLDARGLADAAEDAAREAAAGAGLGPFGTGEDGG